MSLERVVIPAVVADQAAHEAAMIAKVDALATPVVPAAAPVVAPEVLLAGKYKSIEELEKGYTELTKLLGKQGKIPTDQPAAVVTPVVVPVVTVPTTPEEIAAAAAKVATEVDAAKAVVDNAGLSFEKFSTEFDTTGSISEESYTELAAKGIPKSMVDQYIAGQQAVAEKQTVELQSVVGGPEKFGEMIQWAAVNLPKEDIIAFNTSVAGDMNQAKLALMGLSAKFKAGNPTLIQGALGNGTVTGYQSRAEMTADMRDPRYSKDPAFRAQVERKVANAAAGVI